MPTIILSLDASPVWEVRWLARILLLWRSCRRRKCPGMKAFRELPEGEQVGLELACGRAAHFDGYRSVQALSRGLAYLDARAAGNASVNFNNSSPTQASWRSKQKSSMFARVFQCALLDLGLV